MKHTSFYNFEKNWINDMKVGFGANAWYVQKPLSKCRNLFFGVKSNLVVHFFSCDCGKNQIYINASDDSIKHTCEKCKRKNFTSLAYADRRTAYVNFENIYSLEKTKKHYMITCHLKRPKDIDMATNSLVYEKKVAYELKIDQTCEFSSRFEYRITNEVKREARKKLLDFMGKDFEKDIKNFHILGFFERTYESREAIVKFFLKNPMLKEAEFFYMDDVYTDYMAKSQNDTIKKFLDNILPKKARKALKRDFYRDFLRCLKKGYYDVINKEIIFYAFKDENFSRRLIQKEVVFCEYGIEDYKDRIEFFKSLFSFLKQYYSEQELCKISLQIYEHKQYWQDIIYMYQSSKEQINETFTRVNANIIHIHDTFVSCIGYNNKKITFKYTKKEILSCVGLHQGLKFVLPKNSMVLSSWGILLRNCLSTYVKKVENKNSIVVGIFKDKKLKYAMEIDTNEDKDIIQMSGFANETIPELEANTIIKWHKNVWLKM